MMFWDYFIFKPSSKVTLQSSTLDLSLLTRPVFYFLLCFLQSKIRQSLENKLNLLN